MRGWQWPCVVTHQLEMPSIRVEPSAQCSRASLARVTRGIASFRPCCVKGCQTGEALSVIRVCPVGVREPTHPRSEEHTSELQSLMRISYAVFCLTKKKMTIA